MQKPTSIMTSTIKNPKPKTETFFSKIQNFTHLKGFDKLSGSNVWRVLVFSQNDQGYLL